MKNLKNFYQMFANFLNQHKQSASKQSASMIFKSQPKIEKRALINFSEMGKK